MTFTAVSILPATAAMKNPARSSVARPRLAGMSVSWVLCLVLGLMGAMLVAQAAGSLVGAAREEAQAGKVVTLSVSSRALLGRCSRTASSGVPR